VQTVQQDRRFFSPEKRQDGFLTRYLLPVSGIFRGKQLPHLVKQKELKQEDGRCVFSVLIFGIKESVWP
jgi:hypothetical protein